MILFYDSSSLFKLHVIERHSATVREWASEATDLAASRLVFVEIHSAVARRERSGVIAAAQADQVRRDFAAMWEQIAAIDLDHALAAELCARRGLRALDAIHLAAALTVKAAEPAADLAFCCFDAQLNAAAAAEGLRVLTA